MTVTDKKVDNEAAVAKEVIPINIGDVAQGEADVEYASVRAPYDLTVVEAYAWAKAIGASGQTVELEDDGTDISDATAVGTAGAQTEITGVAGTDVAEGSEIQVKVDTSGASETFTQLIVSIVVRPQHMKGDPPEIL